MRTLINVVVLVLVSFVSFGSDSDGLSDDGLLSFVSFGSDVVEAQDAMHCIRHEWTDQAPFGSVVDYEFTFTNTCDYRIVVTWTDNTFGRSGWDRSYRSSWVLDSGETHDTRVTLNRGDSRTPRYIWCAERSESYTSRSRVCRTPNNARR